ncbi:hypothetical protein NDU88_003680 [Pleurodeles waltl]|uniref:Uncharacterized protein n=1 Tax=Pleurodeles waltl TaxID=8319 RepID=A0AAV7M503_PLEWA|nr:hypothetical protein NDU88_003680 [Pleurodeles waltl]
MDGPTPHNLRVCDCDYYATVKSVQNLKDSEQCLKQNKESNTSYKEPCRSLGAPIPQPAARQRQGTATDIPGSEPSPLKMRVHKSEKKQAAKLYLPQDHHKDRTAEDQQAEKTPAADSERRHPCMPRNNLVPKRKAGKPLASCFLCTAPSHRACWETCNGWQTALAHWKQWPIQWPEQGKQQCYPSKPSRLEGSVPGTAVVQAQQG